MGQPLLPSFRQSGNKGSLKNLEKRMPMEGVRKSGFPSTLLVLLPWGSWGGMASCLHTLPKQLHIEEECGRKRRGTGDNRDPEGKREFRAAPWKTNKCTCSLGAKKIGIAGNTGRFVFFLSPPHSLTATKHAEPQHFRSHRQDPTLRFCLPSSQVLLWEILKKVTFKTTFAPVFCESANVANSIAK